MDAGVRIFQFDVGDGHFVEPVTIGPIVLKSISPIVHELGGVLDCHLMVENPEQHFRGDRWRLEETASRCTTRPATTCRA